MQFKDQLDRIVTLKSVPQRIISLVPSQTELLVDLGLENNLVGITKFCVHPKRLRQTIPIVGGTKQVKLNKIINLKPDIIICNKEENTQNMVLELQKIAPVWVSDIINLEHSYDMILNLGSVFHKEKKSSEIVNAIRHEKYSFDEFVSNKVSKKVCYLIWKDPYMSVNKNTFIHELLKLNKFENIITTKESRYPVVSTNKMKEADVILLSTEPYPFKEKDVLDLTERLNKEVKLVNGEYFSWYGSRMLKSFDYFKKLH